MYASTHRVLAIALLAGCLGLGACSNDMDELDRYVNEVKARPGGRIEPLPEIKPYEVFTYVADAEGLRSPFVPDSPQTTGAANTGGPGPDPERSREFLEQFPLDTLRMVGTLELGSTQLRSCADLGRPYPSRSAWQLHGSERRQNRGRN